MTMALAVQETRAAGRTAPTLETSRPPMGRASDYNPSMSATKPKSAAAPKVASPPSKRQDLSRSLPGTDRERAEQRRRFAEEHRETLRRLGK
jgi:hypothetical protein